MHYLDTCVCIEFLRGRLRLGYQEMQAQGPHEFQLPSIVVAELWYCVQHGADPQKNAGIVEVFTSAFSVVPFDEACAREYGRIRQELSAQGDLIGDRDLMIAACALANRATLVTNNLKEFERVPGLPLESWLEVEL